MPSALVYLRLKPNWTSSIFTCETGRRPHKTTSTVGDTAPPPPWAVVLSIVPSSCGSPVEGPPSLCCRERGGDLMPRGPWWGWWHPGSRGVRGAEVWDTPSQLWEGKLLPEEGNRCALCSPERLGGKAALSRRGGKAHPAPSSRLQRTQPSANSRLSGRWVCA